MSLEKKNDLEKKHIFMTTRSALNNHYNLLLVGLFFFIEMETESKLIVKQDKGLDFMCTIRASAAQRLSLKTNSGQSVDDTSQSSKTGFCQALQQETSSVLLFV